MRQAASLPAVQEILFTAIIGVQNVDPLGGAVRIATSHVILYVRDQRGSTRFWSRTLAAEPHLDVPGMTEFLLGDHVVLGLMPEHGARALLGPQVPDPARGTGIPRAELYLLVDQPDRALRRCQDAGATLLSPLQPRAWGDTAGYCLDPDGHVIAFACRDASQ